MAARAWVGMVAAGCFGERCGRARQCLARLSGSRSVRRPRVWFGEGCGCVRPVRRPACRGAGLFGSRACPPGFVVQPRLGGAGADCVVHARRACRGFLGWSGGGAARAVAWPGCRGVERLLRSGAGAFGRRLGPGCQGSWSVRELACACQGSSFSGAGRCWRGSRRAWLAGVLGVSSGEAVRVAGRASLGLVGQGADRAAGVVWWLRRLPPSVVRSRVGGAAARGGTALVGCCGERVVGLVGLSGTPAPAGA